ncbi:MAG: T9SS type A sorting domain-containing protein [Flavobacteriales bacterium]|nr:T9SS type A sorting domain-containing protein [Flavobacteriales bacterium]
MLHRFLIGLTLILGFSTSFAGTIILEGNYQGKNIYVQNPFSGTGVGFCTFEVKVNGNVTTDEINSSAFEIDLANFQLSLGEKVVVVIKHRDDCKPKVLNPEVLKPRSTFNTTEISISGDGILKWKTKDESGKLPYVIEQFRWNKWIKVGETEGAGGAGPNDYSFQITPHSGENLFRVKQVDYTGKPRYSKSVRFASSSSEVAFSPVKVNKELEFTAETMFEIYDSYGNIVKKGYANKVDCTNLKRGIYYLNYDNNTEKFVKK